MKEICRETLERAYLFLDGELLAESERHEIQYHLEQCQPCLERYGLEEEVTHLLSRIKSAHRCPDELKARIAGLLEQA